MATPPTEQELAAISKLSNRELELLRERAKKEAMRACDDVVRQFVECSKPRFISTVWACRAALQEMNDCVLKQ
jgi:COX assembly mitochondrial protein 1